MDRTKTILYNQYVSLDFNKLDEGKEIDASNLTPEDYSLITENQRLENLKFQSIINN